MMNLKTIIILTDYFPPINSAASNRIAAWVNYLPENGYKPIVYVRWYAELPIESKVIADTHEIHYIKCADNKTVCGRNVVTRKISSAINFILSNIYLSSDSAEYIGRVVNYIQGNSVEVMIATGPKFSIFGCAKEINKSTGIKWIADYRDDWSTTDLISGTKGYITKKQVWFEKKYTSSAVAFLTISPWYRDKISEVIKKPGYIVENGYDGDLVTADRTFSKHVKTILYPGQLYETQTMKYFISFLSSLDDSVRTQLEIVFIGNGEVIESRIRNELSVIEGLKLSFRDRVPKDEVDELISSANYCIYFAHIDKDGKPIKGIPSSKLYDYVKYRKKVLMMPSDNDIADQILSECGLIIKEESALELACKFTKTINGVEVASVKQIAPNVKDKYSRKYRTKVLAEVIDSI